MTGDARRRVTILGPAPPDRGGIAHETARLARELSRCAAVEYFTFARAYPRWLDPRRSARDAQLTEAPAIPVLDYRSPKSWRATAGRIAASRPDALIVPWWTAFWALPVRAVLRSLGRRRAPASRLLLCHNVEDHESGAVKRLLTSAALREADGFIVHSYADRDDLARRFPGRPAALLQLPVPDGSPVERSEARRRLGVRGPLVLFTGLVRPYKGVDLLLEAAPRIVEESGCEIAIVGEVFPASRGLSRVHSSSPVRDRILWKDEYVSEEEMGLWLAASDVVVLPYRRISASAIAARAIGAGRPIVAASVGGLRETVVPGVTGELFPAGSAGGLADAVRALLARGPAAYASGLAAAARRAAWPRYAQEILAFIERVRIDDPTRAGD